MKKVKAMKSWKSLSYGHSDESPKYYELRRKQIKTSKRD